MLFWHIVFGLLIYPVAFAFYNVQNRIAFTFPVNAVRDIMMFPLIYFGSRAFLVIFWIYAGFIMAGKIGLHTESENASGELSTVYLTVWVLGVIILSVVAYLRSERRR